jgi:ribosomal protein L37E
MDTKSGTCSVRQHADPIVCRRCGKFGRIIWDDISRLNSFTSELAGIDGPFFERLGREPPYPIELVCRSCGAVAMTAYPSTSLHDRVKYN